MPVLSSNVSFGQAVGTPSLSAEPRTIQNPAFPSTFYYTTNDNIVIFDTIDIYNHDATRDAVVQLVGKVQNSEGWFAFATNPVAVPADNWNAPVEVPFSITIPDGVCEDVYEGFVTVNLIDYDGRDATSGMMVSSTVAVQALFDMVTGVPCVGGEVLPGLGAAPSWIPPDAVEGEVLEDPGGGSPPPPPPVDEYVTFNVLAHPEKRLPKVGNWGTRGVLKLFKNGSSPESYVFAVDTDNAGRGTTDTEVIPGTYDLSFKGLSHLTKYIRGLTTAVAPQVYDLDYTFGDTFDLLAGDVHLSKDDFINSLDLAATVSVLYQNEEHADLNKDGTVNALDLSIEVINLYAEGEEL